MISRLEDILVWGFLVNFTKEINSFFPNFPSPAVVVEG